MTKRATLMTNSLGAQVWRVAEDVQPLFQEIDRLVGFNLARVQSAFRTARIGPHHFAGSTGYGHGDLGRAALDEVRHLASNGSHVCSM